LLLGDLENYKNAAAYAQKEATYFAPFSPDKRETEDSPLVGDPKHGIIDL